MAAPTGTDVTIPGKFWDYGGAVLNARHPDFGAKGDGVTDDAPAITALVTAAAGKATAFLPDGDYLLASTVLLPSDLRLVLSENARLFSNTANAVLLKAESKARLRIRGGKIEGPGSASASTDGIGLYAINCDDVDIDGVHFTGHGGAPVRVEGSDVAGHKNIVARNCRFSGNPKTVSGAAVEFYTLGKLDRVIVRDCLFEADATNPKTHAVQIANLTTLLWRDAQAVGNTIKGGYTIGGIWLVDNDPTGVFRVGEALVDGNAIYDVVQEGIKLKNVFRCRIANNLLVNCSQQPEVAGNLQGAIFVNGSTQSTVTSNVIIGSGNDGIRLAGQTSTLDHDGRAQWVVSGNVIEGCNESGIFVSYRTYNFQIIGNSLRQCSNGIRLNGVSAADVTEYVRDGAIIGNTLRDGQATHGGGIIVAYARNVALSGNVISKWGGFGVQLDNVGNVGLAANEVVDNGQQAVNTQGVRISNATGVRLVGNRSGNLDGATQSYGVGFGAAVTSLLLGDNDLQGNATGPVTNLPVDAMVNPNLGLLDTRVQFAAGDTTPSVKNRSYFRTANTAATSITTLDDGSSGQEVTIEINDAFTTFVHGSLFRLAGGVNWTPGQHDSISFMFDGGAWREKCRSDNG